MNKMRVSKVILLGLGLSSLAAMSGCGRATGSPEGPPPPEVSVAEVVVRELQHWDEFTGRIEAVESVALRPRVSGYIDRLAFVEGGEVAAGDVLFVIDQRTYRAALARAQAEWARADSQWQLARTELERAEKLAAARAISTEELEQKVAAAVQAEANAQAARAAVDSAALELEFTEVRAPVAGRVGRALVTAGNLAQADATVLTHIVSLDPVHVYFESDERTFLRYRELERDGNGSGGGNLVRVGLADESGFPHEGALDFVDNQADPSTGTIRARAVLKNGHRKFMPGLFARVQLVGSTAFEAVLVDDKALLTDQDRKYVYVVGDDGLAVRRDVRPGRKFDDLRVIESGLAPGDRVVVHGVQKVFFPGMPVQARQIAMGEPPAEPAAASF